MLLIIIQIINYIQLDYIDNTINLFKQIFNNNVKFIIINNLPRCKYNNKLYKTYSNISFKQINYLVDKEDFNYLLFTNNNIIFRLTLIQFIFNICNENEVNYYITPNVKCYNTNIDIINCDNKDFLEFTNIENKEEYIDEYNNKIFIKQYDNINEIDFENNLLLVHKNIIDKYGFLSHNYFLSNYKNIITNYFNNLNHINLLPIYFTTFTIEEKSNYLENEKIRQEFKGDKIINEIDKERKDKLIQLQIKQIKTLNNNVEELTTNIDYLNTNIDTLNKSNYELSNKLEDLQDLQDLQDKKLEDLQDLQDKKLNENKKNIQIINDIKELLI